MAAIGRTQGVGSKVISTPGTSLTENGFVYNWPMLLEDTQSERIEGFVRPTGGVNQSGPFEFVIPAVSDGYLLMNKLYLYMVCKITRGDGRDLEAGQHVAPVNLLGSALFEHTEVSLNDYVLASSSSSNTHYKAYLETLLSADVTSANKWLAPQLFVMDTPGHFDVFTAPNPENRAHGLNFGHNTRASLFQLSRQVDLVTPINSDFLQSHTHLAPGNKLTIKMFRARDEFVLKTSEQNANYKLKVQQMKLYYTRVRLADNIGSPDTERYLIHRTEFKKYPVPANMLTYNFKIHYGGKLPKSIVIGQVLTQAVEGSYNHNPWNFQHFNLTHLNLKINGRTWPPDTLRPAFHTPTPLIAREYALLFKNTGMDRLDRGGIISYELFRNGCTLFPFDLSPDNCSGSHYHVSPHGEIEVDFTWGQALAESITILVHLTFDEEYIHRAGDNEITIQQI